MKASLTFYTLAFMGLMLSVGQSDASQSGKGRERMKELVREKKKRTKEEKERAARQNTTVQRAQADHSDTQDEEKQPSSKSDLFEKLSAVAARLAQRHPDRFPQKRDANGEIVKCSVCSEAPRMYFPKKGDADNRENMKTCTSCQKDICVGCFSKAQGLCPHCKLPFFSQQAQDSQAGSSEDQKNEDPENTARELLEEVLRVNEQLQEEVRAWRTKAELAAASGSSKERDGEDEDDECVVCFKNMTTSPCCNKPICVDCWNESLQRTNGTCPYCRQSANPMKI